MLYLYQDLNKKAVQLATYRLTDEKGQYSQFDVKKDRENEIDEVDAGASAIIPVRKGEEEQKRYIYRNNASAKAQLGGLIVVGETTMLYLDDESKATVEYALDEASIFVAWERYDNLRYLLADDYGWLYLLTLLVDGAVVTGMDVKKIGEISKPSAMIYLGNEMLYVGSHEGDSQVVRLDHYGRWARGSAGYAEYCPYIGFHGHGHGQSGGRNSVERVLNRPGPHCYWQRGVQNWEFKKCKKRSGSRRYWSSR